MRILVVENDPNVAKSIVKLLEADHFSVDTAPDGEQGLQLATEFDYDAVLLEWRLPKLDGLTVLRKLRKAGSGCRVMMVTTRTDVSDRVIGLQAGADDYLTKPFSGEELLARLCCLLRRPIAFLDKLQAGDLIMDRMTRTVTRAGKPINLSQREYSMLEYLLCNSGRNVTRDMIVTHVWNIEFDGANNIVDVYVNYLRHKIERGFSSKLIHTIRGTGYVLESRALGPMGLTLNANCNVTYGSGARSESNAALESQGS